MLKIESNRKTAFTLAETLITVVILGIVAVILVPSLIKNQIENANRTKVKKAMASYEKVLNLMIIENDLKSNEMIAEFGQEEGMNGEKCGYTRPYFKSVKNGTDNCKFKTSDGLWWDITDISKPIISFKEEDLTDAQASSEKYTAFYMYGLYDDQDILRVNENGYENDQKNKAFFPLIAGINIYNHNLKIWKYLGYDGDYKKLNYTSMIDCNATSCTKYEYNENGKLLKKHYSCNLSGKNCSYYMIFNYDENGNMTYVANAQGLYMHSNLEYDENGNVTQGTYCPANKPCMNVIFKHDENNNQTARCYSCSNVNNLNSCASCFKYKYNENNQLIEQFDPDKNITEKYEYDNNGTRTAKYECNKNGNNCQGPYSYRYE